MISTENYKRELLFIFFAQKRVIFATTVIVFILALLVAFFWPPTYAAKGTILVRGKNVAKSAESIEDTHLRMFPITKEDLFSEVEILTSHDVVVKALKRVQGIDAEQAVYDVKRSLATEVIPASKVIGVTLYNKDREEAVTVLKALMNAFIAERGLVYNPSEAQGFFSDQAKAFDAGLRAKEQELYELVRETEIADPAKEIENNILLKQDLESVLNTLMSEYIKQNLYIEYLDGVLKSNEIQLYSAIENISINDISSKLHSLILQRSELLKTYHPMSDRTKTMDEQIVRTYATLKAEVIAYKENEANKLRTIEGTIQSLEQRLEDLGSANVRLKEQLIETQRIERDIEILKISYTTFSKRREEAKINSSSNATNLFNISILSEAYPLRSAVFPKKRVVIPFGLLVGFLLGCSLGFLIEYFNHKFMKPSDIEQYLGVPVLFSISDWNANNN